MPPTNIHKHATGVGGPWIHDHKERLRIKYLSVKMICIYYFLPITTTTSAKIDFAIKLYFMTMCNISEYYFLRCMYTSFARFLYYLSKTQCVCVGAGKLVYQNSIIRNKIKLTKRHFSKGWVNDKKLAPFEHERVVFMNVQ